MREAKVGTRCNGKTSKRSSADGRILMSIAPLDLAIVAVYVAVVMGFGGWFFRGQSAERYMAAGRSLPGWAVGLSIFGSYVSSISFLANPGKSWAGNWNAFTFALLMPVAAWITCKWFVPFYRSSGEISAYDHLERRFGTWAKIYSVVCYLALQIARQGTIMFLLSGALLPFVTGADAQPAVEQAAISESAMQPVEADSAGKPAVDPHLRARLILIGVLSLFVTIYPFLGGAEAMIWAGVFQSFVLLAGPIICLAVLFSGMPGGVSEFVSMAAAEDKFSLGSMALDFTTSTFWVVLIFGFVSHIQNFGIDQAYVQRYITARSDRAATRSVWLATWMFIPVSALFFLIGTALWMYYRGQPDSAIAHLKPDDVFPWFMRYGLPTGIRGLVLAALCAAAMDSNLASMATLYWCDIHKPLFRNTPESRGIFILRASTIVFAVLSTVAAMAMLRSKQILDDWWTAAGICGGGMLGLFLLGRLCPKADGRSAAIGAIVGTLVIAWMTISNKTNWLAEEWRSPLHEHMILVVGTATIVGAGWLASLILPRREAA